jgi:SAM-dependent methyltransferase
MTDWQNQYATGQTPWDRGAPAPALLDYLATHPVTGRILVPGCGTGQDVKALAQAGAAEVTGLDLAPLAVERAQQFLADTPHTEVLLGDLFTVNLTWSGNTPVIAPFPQAGGKITCRRLPPP